jgi:hypothetical protein
MVKPMSTLPEINVAPDKQNPLDWRVEAKTDGGIEVAIFSGLEAKSRAVRFARMEYCYVPK